MSSSQWTCSETTLRVITSSPPPTHMTWSMWASSWPSITLSTWSSINNRWTNNLENIHCRMSELRRWPPTVRSSLSGMMCSWCGTPPSMTTSQTPGCPGRRSGPQTLSSTMPRGMGSRAGRWGHSSRLAMISQWMLHCFTPPFVPWLI